MTSTFEMWRNEAIVVMVTLFGVVLFHYATKLWSAPADAALGVIFGTSIAIAAAAFFLTRHLWGLHLSTRAFWFIALYLWCVIGMMFFASKTRPVKLLLGLVSQAGILYALFVML